MLGQVWVGFGRRDCFLGGVGLFTVPGWLAVLVVVTQLLKFFLGLQSEDGASHLFMH